MSALGEIEACIRVEVAKCKGVDPRNVNVLAPVIEELHLHGDDFMAIADFVHRKYKVKPERNSYFSGMSIRDWSEVILNELSRS